MLYLEIVVRLIKLGAYLSTADLFTSICGQLWPAMAMSSSRLIIEKRRSHISSEGKDELEPYSTKRKFCPHCKEGVAVKTFRAHKRLYFNEVWFLDVQLIFITLLSSIRIMK